MPTDNTANANADVDLETIYYRNTTIVGGIRENRFVGTVWVYTRGSCGVDEPSGEMRQQFGLDQNYPNPFNPSTKIRYELPQTSHVTLTVYDMLGRLVSELVNDRRAAGVHEVKLAGTDLASGVYFYRIQAGDFVQTRELLLLL